MSHPSKDSFLVRNEFLIRRLHSLSGLIPVGAYMVVHLLTNASVINGPASFQKNVYMIHSLGKLLPMVEWVFIFLPIIFHAVIGFVIIGGGLQNTGNYPLRNNIRYMLQRVTGGIAFLFIFWHVFHMHGWFHTAWWTENVAKPFGGHMFSPFNAASTAGVALQPTIVAVLYTIGILASVYHLANGIWTMGITWGVWISPAAQRRASVACLIFGLALAAVGLTALGGMRDYGHGEQLQEAISVEDAMFEQKLSAQEVTAESEKRLSPEGRAKLLQDLNAADLNAPAKSNEGASQPAADAAQPSSP